MNIDQIEKGHFPSFGETWPFGETLVKHFSFEMNVDERGKYLILVPFAAK